MVRGFHVIPSTSASTADVSGADSSADRLAQHAAATRSMNFCAPHCFAIVDSGTSFTYAPPQLFDAILAAITDGIPCEWDASSDALQCRGAAYCDFPTLALSFGTDASDGNYFHLAPESYVQCEDGVCEVQLRNHACVCVVECLCGCGDACSMLAPAECARLTPLTGRSIDRSIALDAKQRTRRRPLLVGPRRQLPRRVLHDL